MERDLCENGKAGSSLACHLWEVPIIDVKTTGGGCFVMENSG
jgi:hypothetical protein